MNDIRQKLIKIKFIFSLLSAYNISNCMMRIPPYDNTLRLSNIIHILFQLDCLFFQLAAIAVEVQEVVTQGM